MTKKNAPLKLHVDRRTETAPPQAERSPAVEKLCRTFAETTGWQLSFGSTPDDDAQAIAWSMPIEPTAPESAALQISLSPGDEVKPRMAFEQARLLAGAFGGVVGELQRAKRCVWEREAELAAGVPIAARPEESRLLAERLEAVLRGGAEAVGCRAAGLYLLNDTTTELKLRASFNLPRGRLLERPRALKGSVADLEALLGNAVVLEDTSLLPHWKSPEDFPAAICVPVSTSTTPLGTLWLFADQVRDFNAQETNLVEIVAGRIASDLEREMLLHEGVQTKRVSKQWAGAVAWQRQRMPRVAPMLEGWQVAGWTDQAEGIGGDFYDWSVHHDGRLALAVGDAQGSMLQAGFTSAVMQGALRSHASYVHDAASLLRRVNDTLWTGSVGDEFASLLYGLIDPATGRLELASAGSTTALLIRRTRHERLKGDSVPLGSGPETTSRMIRRKLVKGDVLIGLSEGARKSLERPGSRISENSLATFVRRAATLTALELTERLRDMLQSEGEVRSDVDRTLLVVKRTR